jgi:hypothetical protein
VFHAVNGGNKLFYICASGGFAIHIGYLRRERLFAGTFILFVSLILTRLIRQGWLALCGGICTASPTASFWSTASFGSTAPEAYRVAIPIAQRVLIRLFHLHDGTYGDALIQFTCCFLALFLFYSLAVKGLDASKDRIVSLAMFLAFIQFPFAFILFRQRPETLPTALFLALSLFCISRVGHRWTVALLFFTLIQSFVRADVPFVLGLALVLISLRNPSSHSANLFRGLGTMLVAGCVQLYLQFVCFPHLPYSSRVLVFHENLSRNHLIILFLALAPFLYVLLLLRSSRINLREIDLLAIIASLLYLPLWFTVGVVVEVRIFVPFLLALCVVAARVSSGYLSSNSRAAMVADEN